MAKNQRQRRPLQDDTRANKQTVRERAQVSKRQRDRIEENRDRREQRRERQRARRQIVDSIRSPKEDVRAERLDSRVTPVEDTFLGRPVGSPRELPVLIGERWDLRTNQTLSDNTFEDVEFDTAVFDTSRNGYPALYHTAERKFIIPGGLAGIWEASFKGATAAGISASRWLLNGVQEAYYETGADATVARFIPVSVIRYLNEGDELRIQALQASGVDQILNGTSGWTYATFIFLGK